MIKYKFLQGEDEVQIVAKLNRASREGYEEIVYFRQYPEGARPFSVIVRGNVEDEDESGG